jgi:hypothetical protein
MNEPTPFQSEWLVHIDILPSDVAELTPTTLPADRTPALAYLSGMTTRSRRVMYDGLSIAVSILTMAHTSGLISDFASRFLLNAQQPIPEFQPSGKNSEMIHRWVSSFCAGLVTRAKSFSAISCASTNLPVLFC